MNELQQQKSNVEGAAQDASEHFEWLGRAGWVAKGIVYGLIGILFVQIALSSGRGGGSGEGGEQANQAGAIEEIAETSYGTVLLVAIGIGLALYAVWRILTVVLPGDWTGRALLDRIGYAVSAVVYISLLFTIIGFLRNDGGGSGQSEDRMIEGLVKDTLEMTAGRTLVIIAGLVLAGIGVAFVHKGWTRSFRDDISGDHGIEGTLIDNLGLVGWIARGVSMGIIGYFLARAAWTFDSDEAAGLDDSMRQLADKTWGAILAALVGIGFVAYGVFAAVSARYRDLEGPRND